MKGLWPLIIIVLLLGLIAALPLISISKSDDEYFGIANNEKWNDLRNEQAIEAFTLFHGYDKYRMIRYSNGAQFYNNDVVNPLDAYILMETINGKTKKAEYREYKEWLLCMERINISYT